MTKNKTTKKQLIDDFIEFNSNSDSYKEIINEMIDSETNLSLKTRNKNPLYTTYLNFYSYMLKSFGLIIPAKAVKKKILRTYFKHMISENGLSRQEVFNAITFKPEYYNDENLSFKDKLLKNIKEL